MSTAAIDDFDYRRVVANFSEIAFYKKAGQKLEAIMNTLHLSTNDKKEYDLCKIAFDNSENENAALQLMQQYINKRNNADCTPTVQLNPKEAELIKEITVLVYATNKFAWDKLLLEDPEEYEELFRNLILQRTYCVNTAGNVKVYDIVPVQNRKDDFGSWSYDPFAGHLKLYAKLDGDKFFPRSWKLDAKESKLNIKPTGTMPDDVQQILDINMPLDTFLEQALGGIGIRSVLESLHIKSVENLKTLESSGWKVIESRAPSAWITLKTEVDKLCDNNRVAVEDSRSEAEKDHDWHKVKLFLYYTNKSPKYKKLGLLDKGALELGFKEQSDDKSFDIGSTMGKIQDSLKVFTTSSENTAMREKSHGMMLYGPPGTGKTKLSMIIIKKAGFAQIVEPLSSAELNRSLVGATEKLLMAIFQRATYCPHLLCCVAIDEVDALTPKRNDKAAGHKVDGLSLLLSLIGGIKDVTNVFVIASTNRLNKIDEAFARRLQDKFYIGRLTNKQRIDLLSQIVKNEKAGVKHVQLDFNNIELQSLLAKLTTNFSGAALASLRARILINFDLNPNLTTMTNEALTELAIKVANDFQVKIGRYSIPQLMQSALNRDLTGLWSAVVRDVANLSGKILIELKETSAMIGFEYQSATDEEQSLLEVHLRDDHEVRYVSELIPFILDFCVKFKVDNIQLLDSDALLTAGASDESAINELFNESFEEFDKYDNGIVVFDVDTLVGINETLSDSSMSPSKSYSVQNHRLWQNILHACKRSYFSTDGLTKRKWCMVISGSEFLIDQFKKLVKFPLSEAEKQKKKEEEEASTKVRKCLNCDASYFESQNRIEACTYHNGAIVRYDNQAHPISKETLYNRARLKTKPEEIEAYFKGFYYSCCFRGFFEARDMGCKRNFHSNKETYIFDAKALYPLPRINNSLNK